MQSIWGVPQACGPLPQLATAQAGKELPKLIAQNIGLKVLRRPVLYMSWILVHAVRTAEGTERALDITLRRDERHSAV